MEATNMNERRAGKIPGYAGYVPRCLKPADVAPRTETTGCKEVVPGYTGYIPKNTKSSNTNAKKSSPVAHNIISGYQGFIPSMGSEILHVKEKNEIADRFAGKTKNAGLRITASERFKTSNMEFFKDPDVVKMPTYEPPAREVVAESKEQTRPLPSAAANKFWGVTRSETMSSAARKFFD
eukprot:TRINITY_DN1220_c0_g1_i4.p1 TRINITY_DN1220_c0_g1~~TRINITY_DN1220_c0_g1_i4.p1  ORF type:complete len:180 (+),score=61.37 TRINITY_DN1220_c0_g1_i4:73-612(+)